MRKPKIPHEIMQCPLCGPSVELHRYEKNGTPYSAIYMNGKFMTSFPRKKEKENIRLFASNLKSLIGGGR